MHKHAGKLRVRLPNREISDRQVANTNLLKAVIANQEGLWKIGQTGRYIVSRNQTTEIRVTEAGILVHEKNEKNHIGRRVLFISLPGSV